MVGPSQADKAIFEYIGMAIFGQPARLGNKKTLDNENLIEKIAAAPAQTLEVTLKAGQAAAQVIKNQPSIKKAGNYWATLGPGLTTGAADDDPSGIATYSQTGASYGFGLLWLSALTFPLMAVVQEMCARIGLVTGRGLAANIRLHYSKWILYGCTLLLFAANTFNIGADLGAMAKATQLLWPNSNFNFLVIFFALGSLLLQIFVGYKQYAKYLKWLALILFAYVFTAFFIPLDWPSVLKATVVPRLQFGKDQIFLICGILGTTISPYLFFWQTSQEVEEQILEGKTTIKLRQSVTTPREIKKMRLDVWSGMLFSNLVMFFIILTCGAELYQNGISNIRTAADAALALRPLAGQYAFLLFSAGIIGIGLQSVPVLAGSASYALSEAFGWKQGLYRKLKQAYAFYGVIIIAMLIGLLMNFTSLDPIKALIYAAVINGLVAPVVLVPIVRISNNPRTMGRWKNSQAANVFGWLTILLMALAGLATIIYLF